jgi:hypothetical protein
MTLFHLSGGLFGPGSVIIPGNWGRILKAQSWQHAQAAKEVMLETARLRVAPEKPSRLECCFAFLSPEEADRFRPYAGFVHHVLYEVELVDPEKGFSVCDIALMKVDGPLRVDWADAYWNGVVEIAETRPPNIREILTLSALRIIRQL